MSTTVLKRKQYDGVCKLCRLYRRPPDSDAQILQGYKEGFNLPKPAVEDGHTASSSNYIEIHNLL